MSTVSEKMKMQFFPECFYQQQHAVLHQIIDVAWDFNHKWTVCLKCRDENRNIFNKRLLHLIYSFNLSLLSSELTVESEYLSCVCSLTRSPPSSSLVWVVWESWQTSFSFSSSSSRDLWEGETTTPQSLQTLLCNKPPLKVLESR